MVEEETGTEVGSEKIGTSTDAAVIQIREVVKWLIGGFAAVGVALAAGSQLSDIGSLEGLRLAAAFAAVFLTLVGISLAIGFAVKVLTPAPAGLRRLALEEDTSEVGKAIADDPSLLLGHGGSIKEFEERRKAALKGEDEAWERFDAKPDDKALQAKALKATADRERIEEAMTWLFSFARYTEASRSFKNSLRAMFAAAALAAIGIAGFAWAAHPEGKKEMGAAEPIVAKAPAEVEIDLSNQGEEALGDNLGAKCDLDAVHAVAVAGTPEALEVVSLPMDSCQIVRFDLTSDLGTFQSLEPPPTRPNPKPPVG